MNAYHWDKGDEQYRPDGVPPKSEILEAASQISPKITPVKSGTSKAAFQPAPRPAPQADKAAHARASLIREVLEGFPRVPDRCDSCGKVLTGLLGKGVVVGQAGFTHDKKGCR